MRVLGIARTTTAVLGWGFRVAAGFTCVLTPPRASTFQPFWITHTDLPRVRKRPSMKILVSQIKANPHRDLVRNPVSPDQITKLVESISRTGFWDNLVVRPHPEVEGNYQLAYGHNRMEACIQAGIVEVDVPVRELSDYDMFCCMVDENNTQQTISPKIVFENVTAAIALAESLLLSTENVNDFNELIKLGHRPDGDGGFFWRVEEYTKAKSSISEDGDGLGKDFVSHFMPSPPANDTLQSVIDSYYADRRKKAADARAAKEEEAARIADEERKRLEEAARIQEETERKAQLEKAAAKQKQREAEEAAVQAVKDNDEAARIQALKDAKEQRQAKARAAAAEETAAKEKTALNRKAEKERSKSATHSSNASRERSKSERMDYAGIDRDLLEQLPTSSHMNDVVKLIKKCKIPKEHHSELIEEAKGWSPDGTSSIKAGTSISSQGAQWWDVKSGNQANRLAEMRRKSREDVLRNKYGNQPFESVPFSFADRLREANNGGLADLLRCSEHFEFLNKERLERLKNILVSIKNSHVNSMNVLIERIDLVLQPIEKDITPNLPALEFNKDA